MWMNMFYWFSFVFQLNSTRGLSVISPRQDFWFLFFFCTAIFISTSGTAGPFVLNRFVLAGKTNASWLRISGTAVSKRLTEGTIWWPEASGTSQAWMLIDHNCRFVTALNIIVFFFSLEWCKWVEICCQPWNILQRQLWKETGGVKDGDTEMELHWQCC